MRARNCRPSAQAFYAAGEDNGIFLAKIEEIKASHRHAPARRGPSPVLCARCARRCVWCCGVNDGKSARVYT